MKVQEKKLKLGAIPTINLPIKGPPLKCHATKIFPERRHINIIHDYFPVQPKRKIKHKSFYDLVKKINHLN